MLAYHSILQFVLRAACRVLLPYVHVLVPQQASSGRGRARDFSTKLRKLKQYIKRRLGPEGLPPGAAGGAGGGAGGSAGGAAGALVPAVPAAQQQELSGQLHQVGVLQVQHITLCTCLHADAAAF